MTGRANPDDDWLHDLFDPVGPISIRRMFGGAGIYRDGVMFALVADTQIYLKCNETSAPRFAAAGCRPFLYEKAGKSIEMSYRSLPDEAADDPEILKVWVDLACNAAFEAARKSRKKPA